MVCGVREELDEHGFPRLVRGGLSANLLREIEGQVLTRCRERVHPAIAPRVEELAADTADARVLVFIQPATGQGHLVREGDEGGKYFGASVARPWKRATDYCGSYWFDREACCRGTIALAAWPALKTCDRHFRRPGCRKPSATWTTTLTRNFRLVPLCPPCAFESL